MDKPVDEANPAADKEEDLNAPIPLHFNIPPGISARYAHHMIVQRAENEVTLSFFEVMAPPLIGIPPEEQVAILRRDGVRADCVARVVISRTRLNDFLKALEESKDAKSDNGG